jgi:hypothetical protein
MKLFCNYDRFELEQDIIKAWGVVEEIDELIRQHLDSSVGPFDEDELANRLQAIQYMSDMRFQRIWDGFEKMLKNDQFVRKEFKPDVEFPIKQKKGSKK